MTTLVGTALRAQAAVLDALADQFDAEAAPTPTPTPPPSDLPTDINALARPGGTVFEYGDLFTYPAPNSGAAHADYVVNGQTIKNHFWGSRWYDGAFVVKNKIADLVAAKLVPPHTADLANVTAHLFSGQYDANNLPNPITFKGPMDYQLPFTMGQTGDNPGIGPYSEWEAAMVATGAASLAGSVEAMARFAMTLPIHVRDPKTGRPISFKDYPAFTCYADQNNSMVTPSLRTAILGYSPSGLQFDAAHHPQFCFLAGLLTDDPVWCEELQYLATFTWAFDFPNPGHEDNIQIREMAWDMRTICNTITLTKYFEQKGLLPASCHPSQYFIDVMLHPTIAWLMNFTGDSTPLGFSQPLMWGPKTYAPWQWDFMAISVATGIYQGLTELQPVFDWIAAGLVERLTGKLGWNPDYPTLYYISTPKATWKDSWTEVVAENSGYAIPTPAGAFLPPLLQNDYSDYVAWMAAAVRMGKLIGHTDLSALYPTFESRVTNSAIPRNYRHCIGSALVAQPLT